MLSELKATQVKTNLISEINGGFPHFWVFITPLDLSYCKECFESFKNDEYLEERNLNKMLDNIGINSLKDDHIEIVHNNSFTNLISSEEDFTNKTRETSPEKNSNKKSQKNLPKPFKQENYESNRLKGVLIENNKFLFDKGERGKVKGSIINVDDCEHKIKEEAEIPLSQIQSYNINIYNPNINCVNICYPHLSCNPFSSTKNNSIDKKINNSNILDNDEDILTEKLPHNLTYQNDKNINDLLSNLSYENSSYNNYNFLINNSFNNLEENFSVNYLQHCFGNNIITNSNDNINIKDILNNKENENCITTKKANKKNKKKKKKKIDDEYIVEMFGRRGWICEGCNNFNYESRKNCNRCKIPKKPLKKSVILDNKGNKIIDNLNNASHKDDWNCYNCGNINYAFRLNCNRCQMKRIYSNEVNKEDK